MKLEQQSPPEGRAVHFVTALELLAAAEVPPILPDSIKTELERIQLQARGLRFATIKQVLTSEHSVAGLARKLATNIRTVWRWFREPELAALLPNRSGMTSEKAP